MKSIIVHFVAGLALGLGAQVQAADTYPEKPIRLVVGQSPGSATDNIARALAEHMSGELKQSVIVVNQPGAGGGVAATAVARERADGYSVMFATVSQLSLNPWFYESLAYEPFKDFTYIAPVADVPMLLVASRASGIRDFADFVRKAKASPGTLNYSSWGAGTASHLSMEMIAILTGVSLTHIPYKGTAPALASIFSGETDVNVTVLGSGIPAVRGDQVVPLALLQPRRDSRLPDTPTLRELGVEAPEFPSWIGMVGPAGLPQPITDTLAKALGKAISDPAIQQRFNQLALIPLHGDGAQLMHKAKSDSNIWGKLIQDRGITLE